MYKTTILLCFLTGILNAQTEVKFSLVSFATKGFQLGVEHPMTDFWSTSIDGKIERNVTALRMANKMFVDHTGGVNAYVGMYTTYDPLEGRWALGMLAGYKLRLRGNLFAEAELGFGRWTDDDQPAGYFKVDVGYRINWKKNKKKTVENIIFRPAIIEDLCYQSLWKSKIRTSDTRDANGD